MICSPLWPEILTPWCLTPVASSLQVGSIVDAKDPSMGAWFEAEVVDVSLADEKCNNSILYHVRYEG